MIRTQARKWTITVNNKVNGKLKDKMKAKLMLLDSNGGNILKVRRYKGRLKGCWSYE